MTELGQKKTAIMSAIASGQLTNLLADCTFGNGRFDNNGNISPTNAARYTQEYIEVDITKRYFLWYGTTSGVSNLLNARVCQYQNDETFVRMDTEFNANASNQAKTAKFSNPKIRICFNYYSDLEVGLYDADRIEEILTPSTVKL